MNPDQQSNFPIETISMAAVLKWPEPIQQQFQFDLHQMMLQAFANMSVDERADWVADYFRQPGGQFQREVIILRDKAGRLIASSLFDYGPLVSERQAMLGVYVLDCIVLPEYQGSGVGKRMAVHIFQEWQPDILFITCAQSASLHLWVGLVTKGIIPGYKVYPYLTHDTPGEGLVTVPYEDLGFIINTFKQIYLGVVGQEELLKQAILHLTVGMVRKNLYRGLYDFDPWAKNGATDYLANSLGVTAQDGVMVIFEKTPPLL